MSLPVNAVNTDGGGSRAKRLAVALLGVAIFLGAASIIKPPPRSAKAGPQRVQETPEMKQLREAVRMSYDSPMPMGETSVQERELVERMKSSLASEQERLKLLKQAPEAAHWRVIGMLEGREFTVLCHATPNGPRYSVFNKDGVLMPGGAGMMADEVYRSFPSVDIENMQLDPAAGLPLMMVDTE